MDSLMPLRPLEADFRRFYEATGKQTENRALTIEEFEAAISSAGGKFQHLARNPFGTYSNRLDEATYFVEREDVTIVQHLRYMPAVYHASEFFELACVLSGEITVYIGEKRLLLQEGDILILAPKTSHAACVYVDNGIMMNLLVRRSTFEESFMNLFPENDLLKGFFEKALYRSKATPYLIFHTHDGAFLRHYVVHMYEEYHRNHRYRNTALVCLLQLFFVTLLRHYEKDVFVPAMNASMMNEDTVLILEYLQSNIQTVTLHHLAAYFNYSERQMQRILQTATGMSFVENVKRLRMRCAAELLRDGDARVADIADYLGYYDVSSFRHAFRAYYGTTPQEYRIRESQTKPEVS